MTGCGLRTADCGLRWTLTVVAVAAIGSGFIQSNLDIEFTVPPSLIFSRSNCC